MCTQEVDAALRWLQYKGSAEWVEWIPDNLQSAVCAVPPAFPPGVETSGTFIANNTAVSGVFGRVLSQATNMLARGAFIHSYFAEGMEVGELREGKAALSSRFVFNAFIVHSLGSKCPVRYNLYLG